MSNNVRARLNEEEKAKRRVILQDFAQWKEETGSVSVAQYARERDMPYAYLDTVTKWERSLHQGQKPCKDKDGRQGFTRVAKPSLLVQGGGRTSSMVRIMVGGVAVEVGEGSSRAALATVLSVLGVGHVPGL